MGREVRVLIQGNVTRKAKLVQYFCSKFLIVFKALASVTGYAKPNPKYESSFVNIHLSSPQAIKSQYYLLASYELDLFSWEYFPGLFANTAFLMANGIFIINGLSFSKGRW